MKPDQKPNFIKKLVIQGIYEGLKLLGFEEINHFRLSASSSKLR